MVTARVRAVPKADTPRAREDFICQMICHERAARPEKRTRTCIPARDRTGLDTG
jgi:hypothetical protein